MNWRDAFIVLHVVWGRTASIWLGPRGALVFAALAARGMPPVMALQVGVLMVVSAVAYVGEARSDPNDKLMRFVGVGHAAVHALLWMAGAGIVTSAVNAVHGAPGVWAVLGARIPTDVVNAIGIFAELVANFALLGYMVSTTIFLFILTGRGIKSFYHKRLV